MPITRLEDDIDANVERREPRYPTTDETDADIPVPGDAPTPGNLEDLAALQAIGRGVPIAIETRKVIVVEYGQQVGAVVLDGTGFGATLIAQVPTNEYWLLDNVIARAGAAGSFLVYERGSATLQNDQDLIWSDLLAAPAFAKASAPAECVLRPGSNIVGAFVGGGAAAAATIKIAYRVGVLVPGKQEVRP